MKPVFTTTSRKPRKRARNGAIPPHQNQKFRKQPSAVKIMLTLFWDEREVILEHYMPRGNTVTSATYAYLLKNHLRPTIKSKRRGRLNIGILLQHGTARLHTARSTVVTIQHLSLECLPHSPYSSDFGPPVTFMYLDRSKRRWEASLSHPTKRCSRRCRSGCALSQKNYFLEVSMYFWSAETLVWKAMETI